MRNLLILSLIALLIFTYFSYIVAKERWTKLDFDSMVKIQDKIPKSWDDNFSLFSLLGSAEITLGLCIILALLALVRFKWFVIMGWLLIIPASLAEVFGKLVLYHPGPPVFFHRTTLTTHLPSFYVHTEFSYPSGHMTRTIFIVTVLSCLIFFSKISLTYKYLLIFVLIGSGGLMGLTRVSLGEHWLSDVLGGGILGVAMGFFAAGLILWTKNLSIATSKV